MSKMIAFAGVVFVVGFVLIGLGHGHPDSTMRIGYGLIGSACTTAAIAWGRR